MMKKYTPFLFHFLFCLPFLVFLGMASKEHYQEPLKLAFFITIAFLLVIGIFQPKFYKQNTETDHWTVIPITALGSILTYGLQEKLGLNPLFAAGIIGVIGSLIEKNSKFNFALPLYCGVFVGMTNPSLQLPYFYIGLTGLFAGILYYFSKNFYVGIGGKLGTIAFVTVFTLVFIYKTFGYAIFE